MRDTLTGYATARHPMCMSVPYFHYCGGSGRYRAHIVNITSNGGIVTHSDHALKSVTASGQVGHRLQVDRCGRRDAIQKRRAMNAIPNLPRYGGALSHIVSFTWQIYKKPSNIAQKYSEWTLLIGHTYVVFVHACSCIFRLSLALEKWKVAPGRVFAVATFFVQLFVWSKYNNYATLVASVTMVALQRGRCPGCQIRYE